MGGFSMQPTVFSGDQRIFPICKKYIEEAGDDPELEGCVAMTVGILGHRKMRIATEYLLKKYREAIAKQASFEILNIYGWTIYKIRDERYIKDYIELIDPKTINVLSSHIIELLGKLKVHEVEDTLITLVDHRSAPTLHEPDPLFTDMGWNLTVSKSAIKTLGFLKCKKALPVIEKYLYPETLPGFFPNEKERKYKITEFRNLARKTIERINR